MCDKTSKSKQGWMSNLGLYHTADVMSRGQNVFGSKCSEDVELGP
jgi:hypothetical protein